MQGRDFIAEGYEEGPEIGILVKRAYEHQLDTGITDKAELIRLAIKDVMLVCSHPDQH